MSAKKKEEKKSAVTTVYGGHAFVCEAPWEQRRATLGDLHAYGRQSGSSLGACVSFPPGGQVVHVFSQGDNVRQDTGLSACQ